MALNLAVCLSWMLLGAAGAALLGIHRAFVSPVLRLDKPRPAVPPSCKECGRAMVEGWVCPPCEAAATDEIDAYRALRAGIRTMNLTEENGDPVSLETLCARDPLWAALQIYYLTGLVEGRKTDV